MNEYCVKIVLFKGCHADDVVYYRNKLPMRLIEKWRWYFEYIAARIKVCNPRLKVELTICPQTLLQGNEYIEQKSKTLLRAKKSALKKCNKEVIADDLFSIKIKKHNLKKQKLEDEIKALEEGKFNYYVPVEYIFKMKNIGESRPICYRYKTKKCNLCHECDTDIFNPISY